MCCSGASAMGWRVRPVTRAALLAAGCVRRLHILESNFDMHILMNSGKCVCVSTSPSTTGIRVCIRVCVYLCVCVCVFADVSPPLTCPNRPHAQNTSGSACCIVAPSTSSIAARSTSIGHTTGQPYQHTTILLCLLHTAIDPNTPYAGFCVSGHMHPHVLETCAPHSHP